MGVLLIDEPQPPRRRRAHQPHDLRALPLGQPPHTAGTRPIPNPSTPTALNRCSHRRTVCSWQANSAAICGTVSPSQLAATICARCFQPAGA